MQSFSPPSVLVPSPLQQWPHPALLEELDELLLEDELLDELEEDDEDELLELEELDELLDDELEDEGCGGGLLVELLVGPQSPGFGQGSYRCGRLATSDASKSHLIRQLPMTAVSQLLLSISGIALCIFMTDSRIPGCHHVTALSVVSVLPVTTAVAVW